MSNDTLFKIDRRRFVIAGSSGLVGLSMLAPAAAGAEAPILGSVGYWLGSEHLSRLSDWIDGNLEDTYFRVVSTERAPQSDPRFIERGMRLTVWGMRGDNGLGGVREVLLTSSVKVDDGGAVQTLPFHVWSLERGPVRKESAPVGFNATVEFGRPVDLLLSFDPVVRRRGVRTGEAPAPDVRFRFAMEHGNEAKVLRGVHFLGLSPEPIDWSRLSFVRLDEAGPRALVERTLLGLRPVSFPHFVIGIDFVGGYDS